jgi:hypothetical protein
VTVGTDGFPGALCGCPRVGVVVVGVEARLIDQPFAFVALATGGYGQEHAGQHQGRDQQGEENHDRSQGARR